MTAHIVPSNVRQVTRGMHVLLYVLTALTFVVNRASDRYTGRLTDAEIADRIATGAGHLGPSAEYLFRTAEACAREGILDAHLWNLQALVAERLEARAAS